jgi:predicted secreted acid phosphatase
MRKETMSAADWSAKYRGRDWSRFAKETVEKFVFGPRGAEQYSQAEAYRLYYMKLENRNLAEEQAKPEKDIGR